MGLQIMKQQIECPSCGAIRCYEHCNNCGIKVRWEKDPYSDKWIMIEESTGVQHFGCMKKGTGKWLRINEEPFEPVKNKWVTLTWSHGQWKCSNCGGLYDKPRADKHWNEDGHFCKKIWKQKEWKSVENDKPTVDLKNQRMDAFLKKV